jgi:non-homologous end joining protein Ku
MVKQRAKGAKPAQEPPAAAKETKVIDLMEALRRSVSEQSGEGKQRAKRSSRAKRAG